MKPYKTAEANDKVRNAVRFMRNYITEHRSISRSYYDSDEYTWFVFGVCKDNNLDIDSLGMAKKVAWFIRADGARDQKALEIWGFNQYTA